MGNYNENNVLQGAQCKKIPLVRVGFFVGQGCFLYSKTSRVVVLGRLVRRLFY